MAERVHLAGIGGVGMSALAQALLDEGLRVSGSDRLLDAGDCTDALQRLQAQGVPVLPQDGSGVAGASRLIVSTAVEESNPDVTAARQAGIPIVHRAAELSRWVGERRLIAVAGTCGKSTVTAMTGWLLAAAGFDPAVVNGAVVVGWDTDNRIGAVRHGSRDWAVVEVDESDRSLLAFTPAHAIITNASADHFDLDQTRQLFSAFRGRVAGAVIDDKPGHPDGMETTGWHGRFRLEGVSFVVPMPGRHNILNAWQAVRMARVLGVRTAELAAALASFRGVQRRLERVGEVAGAVVIDDYAHNPAKLTAAWEALAAAFDRVVAVWRPHGFGPLRNMMSDLETAFASVVRAGDTLLLLPVYDAGGTADRSVRSDDLAARLQHRGVPARPVADLAQAEEVMRRLAGPGAALVTFGARDPGLPRLARRLAVSPPQAV